MTVVRGGETDEIIALGLVDRSMPGHGISRLVADAEQHAPGMPLLVGAVVFPAHRLADIENALRELANDPEWGGEVVVP